MSDAAREMTLAEWVDRLPPIHGARAEYSALIAAAERAEEHRQEIRDLTWNLAGCDTIATSGKPQEFSQELARPALHAVNALAKRADAAEKRVRELEEQVASLRKPVHHHDVDEFYKDDTALGKEPRP